jgi:ABC-2 type transport system permease protein
VSGFRIFLRKEFAEIVRTWRIWVLPLILIGFGVSSPIVASLTPALVDSIAGSQPGVVIQIPEPTTTDAYLQFLNDYSQIVLIAIIIATAGVVSSEKRSGTAVLVLTKPVSRDAFLGAKAVSNTVLVAGATLIGWGMCVLGTAMLFGLENLDLFARATGAWLVLAMMFVAVMLLFSVLFRSQGGAAGMGLLVYVVLIAFSGWGPARDNTVAGLFTGGVRLVGGEDPSLALPVATAVAIAIACFVGAAFVFRRQEL